MATINSNDSIIRLFHVYKTFCGKHALTDISLDIQKNEFLFCTGPSGAGKSTLLKLFYLGEKASSGQILVDGINLERIPCQRIPLLRRKFGIIFQDFKLIPTKTVFENVALVLEAVGKNKRLLQKQVRQVLHRVGMKDRMGAFPLSLSGGEQQRIAIARAIIGKPKIILADEPTGSLDLESAAVVYDMLREVHKNGATVIVATHDRSLIQGTDSRVIHLSGGRLTGVDDRTPKNNFMPAPEFDISGMFEC